MEKKNIFHSIHRTTLTLVLGLVWLLTFTLIALAVEGDIKKDYFDSGGTTLNNIFDYETGIAFTPSTNYNVTRFGVYIKRLGEGEGLNVNISMREMTGENWTDMGAVLATSNTPFMNILTAQYDWYWTWPYESLAVDNVTEYMVSIKFAGGVNPTKGISWWGEGNDDKGFQMWYTYPEADEFSAINPDWDCYFQVYGTTRPVYYPGPGQEPIISDNSTETGLWTVCVDNREYITTDNTTWIYTGSCGLVGDEGEAFVVKETVEESLDDTMDFLGMDNPAGQWLIMASLIAISAAWFSYKRQKFAAFAVPACIFGAGIAMGWVQVWVIILMAVALALFGYTKFKPKGSYER